MAFAAVFFALLFKTLLDASKAALKTQTALRSAIWGPFLKGSGEPFSSKLAPEIPDLSAV